MKDLRTLFHRTALGVAVCCSLSVHAAAQSTPNATQQRSKSQTAIPVTMTECEGTNNCATWTFLGTQGNGQWPSGEVANLTVENTDADTVIIRRSDSTGSSAGLTAVYKGTRHDDRFGGEFTSSWPGHWDNKSGNWYATIGKVESLPRVLHVCLQNCATMVWEDGHYKLAAGGGGNGTNMTWTVETFTRESVIIHRTNYNANGTSFESLLTGQISNEGNSIVNGLNHINNQSIPNFRMTWGTALNSIPGSNGPAPVVLVRPLVCFLSFFGVVCR